MKRQLYIVYVQTSFFVIEDNIYSNYLCYDDNDVYQVKFDALVFKELEYDYL